MLFRSYPFTAGVAAGNIEVLAAPDRTDGSVLAAGTDANFERGIRASPRRRCRWRTNLKHNRRFVDRSGLCRLRGGVTDEGKRQQAQRCADHSADAKSCQKREGKEMKPGRFIH